jgi:hypothetical protein
MKDENCIFFVYTFIYKFASNNIFSVENTNNVLVDEIL